LLLLLITAASCKDKPDSSLADSGPDTSSEADADADTDADTDTDTDTDADADSNWDSDTGIAVDADGDGHTAQDDCDDADSAVHPGAEELCDEKDNDCDGEIDEDVLVTYYLDEDGDGWGDSSDTVEACEQPAGYALTGGDCEPEDAEVHPGALELRDGVDNDCDGDVDYLLLSDADATLTGASAGDNAGRSISGAGDLDGDGHDDLLVGAPFEGSAGTNAGAAYVVYGPVSGSAYLSKAGHQLLGEQPGDQAGGSVAGVGDLDGDGYGDILVGAPYQDDAGQDAGAVYLVLGPATGSTDLGLADAILLGEAESNQAGTAVAAAGDVDADGQLDALVAASGASSTAGAVYVLPAPQSGTMDLGDAKAKIRGETRGDSAGGVALYAEAAAGAGDMDGDGISDLVIGALNESTEGASAGAAYVMYGPISGTQSLSSADAKLLGEGEGHYAGWSVAGAGDMNGDGYDDALVGACAEDTGGGWAGAAYVVLGPPTGERSLGQAHAKLMGEDVGDTAGFSVDAAGDMDGDGRADVLVGVPGESSLQSYAGAAYAVLGPVTGSLSLGSPSMMMLGVSSSDYAGWSVSTAGDTDADGLDDLFIGAPQDTSGAGGAGTAHLVLGRAR